MLFHINVSAPAFDWKDADWNKKLPTNSPPAQAFVFFFPNILFIFKFWLLEIETALMSFLRLTYESAIVKPTRCS